MEQNYIPQRGVDFDDYIGTSYFEKSLKMQAPQMIPVFCPANESHEDDFIGIRLSGYADSDKGLVQVTKMLYPAKNFTKEDLAKLFNEVKLEDGTKRYTPKSNGSFDEVYIRVCYSKQEGKEDNIKWVAAVDGGEAVVLHGERRVYQPKDAEE